MPTLSAVLIAQDEERTIGKVLASVRDMVDEIILVDSGSTDATMEIARQFDAKVISQQWLGYAAQKNFAISQASSEWILSLDADEIITPALAAEIKSVLAREASSVDGFRIARLMHVGEVAIAHGGFYPDRQLRLFKRGKGQFNDRLVHESIVLDGVKEDLKEHLLHMSYRDVEHFRMAHEKYARLAAKEAMKKGFRSSKTSSINLYLHPLWTFFYRYFIRRGFLDGSLGLEMNLAYSDYVRKKILYLREEVQISSSSSTGSRSSN